MNGIPIKGIAKGNAGDVFTIAKLRGAKRLEFLLAYLTELYLFSSKYGINADVLIGQADLETNSFQSLYYTRDGNVAGFGAFDDGTNLGLQYSAAAAARGQVIHHCAYAGIPVPIGDQAFDPRYQAVFTAGYNGDVETTADYGKGLWATDPDYGRKLVERYESYFGTILASGGVPLVGMKKHNLPGCSEDIWLPDDITVIVDIADSPRVRSFQKRTSFTRTTWHDTGNFKTTVFAENTWLQNGRPGGEPGGYNAILGDKTIIYTVPMDEKTWGAGTETGNNTSAHTEQALNVKSWDVTIATGAAWHGAICAAMGWDVGVALVQHNVWYGKDCPGQIRKRGLWPKVVQMTKDAATRARLAASGDALPDSIPKPTYAKPEPIPELAETDLSKGDTAPNVVSVDGTDFVFVYDLVEAIRATPRLRYSSGDERVGPDIKKGEQFIVAWQFKFEDSFMYLTPFSTRVRAKDTKRIDDSVEEGA